mmetsp:Transcript_23713/g.34950  ORF Transcript_23713/g.34950 Transcript_23713/m.34950 type:complete len:187 (+) Transcript_23713:40-600(+)
MRKTAILRRRGSLDEKENRQQTSNQPNCLGAHNPLLFLNTIACSKQANDEGNNQQSTSTSNKASQWHKGAPYVHLTKPAQTKVWHYSIDLGEFVLSNCRVLSPSVTGRVLQRWCSGRINHQSRGPPIWHLRGQRTAQGEGLLATSTCGRGGVFLEGGWEGRYRPDRARKVVHESQGGLQARIITGP